MLVGGRCRQISTKNTGPRILKQPVSATHHPHSRRNIAAMVGLLAEAPADDKFASDRLVRFRRVQQILVYRHFR